MTEEQLKNNIAKNISELRKASGLTQAQLAEIKLSEEEPIVVVVAGDQKIDNAKYKAKFGAKAKMLSHDEAADLIGHAVGGVCPFAVNEGVEVYLDESIKRFDTVFPAAGSSNSAIELTIPEMEAYSGYTAWVDVCKAWRE
mgnify:CR=1 FL=1